MKQLITISEDTNTSSNGCTKLMKLVLYAQVMLSVNQVIKLKTILSQKLASLSQQLVNEADTTGTNEISQRLHSYYSTCTCLYPIRSEMGRTPRSLQDLLHVVKFLIICHAVHCLVLKT